MASLAALGSRQSRFSVWLDRAPQTVVSRIRCVIPKNGQTDVHWRWHDASHGHLVFRAAPDLSRQVLRHPVAEHAARSFDEDEVIYELGIESGSSSSFGVAW
jgi:hypothetical protein